MAKIFLMALLSLSVVGAWASVETGKPAPDFSLKAVDGSQVKLSSFKGKTVVLEWFNKDCPYVRKFYDAGKMQELQKEQTAKGIVWLTVASSAKGKEGHVSAETGPAIFKEKKLASTALLMDADGTVAKLYGAKTTPHMYIVDKKGLLAYQGAIDDRPSASQKSLKGAQNYVVSALESLSKSEPVKNASTTPYGCSVKY